MSHRSSILGSLIRTFVASYAREIPPDVASLVSITRVTVSSDRSVASVYLTALARAQGALAYLRKNKGALKRDMGRTLKLTKVPELRFALDEETERSARIDRLLAE